MAIIFTLIGAGVAILFAVATLLFKIIYSFIRKMYGMSVKEGAYFQDYSKHSRRAREARKIEAETHALAEYALTRASWTDEYIKENGEKQRQKDEKFLKRTLRAIKWQSAGLLMPQGLAQTFATRFFTLGIHTQDFVDEEGNTFRQVIDPNWQNGDDEAEGTGKFTHPYRSSIKIAVIATIALRALDPSMGLADGIGAGISLGITVPFILKCFEVMASIRLRFLAERSHRAVVISQYPCIEGRNISEAEKEFLAYVCEMHRRYEGEPVWKPRDDYGLLMPYEFCAFLGKKGTIGKADNWIDSELLKRDKAGHLAAILFRQVGKQTASEEEAYGSETSKMSIKDQEELKKQREEKMRMAAATLKENCELLADCLGDAEMMSERYDRFCAMHAAGQLGEEDWILINKWHSYIMPVMKQCGTTFGREIVRNPERDLNLSTDESVFGHTYAG